MAKKLPGLKRQAPEGLSSQADDGLEKPAPGKATAKKTATKRNTPKEPSRKPPKSKASESRQQASGENPETTPKSTDSNHDPSSEQLILANAIVKRYTRWSIAGGAVPVPGIDMMAIGGIQIAMVRELAKLYEVPYRKTVAKSLVSALLGSIVPYATGVGVAGSLVKIMPVIGWGLGLATISAMSGATTQTLGLIFIRHFETGGNLMDFNPDTRRAHFRK